MSEIPRPELHAPKQQETRVSIPFEQISSEIAAQLKLHDIDDTIANDSSTESLEATLEVIDAGRPTLPRTATVTADSLGQWVIGQADQLLAVFEHGAPTWSKEQGIDVTVTRTNLPLFSLHIERPKQ